MNIETLLKSFEDSYVKDFISALKVPLSVHINFFPIEAQEEILFKTVINLFEMVLQETSESTSKDNILAKKIVSDFKEQLGVFLDTLPQEEQENIIHKTYIALWNKARSELSISN
jgi:hypothetical protein